MDSIDELLIITCSNFPGQEKIPTLFAHVCACDIFILFTITEVSSFLFLLAVTESRSHCHDKPSLLAIDFTVSRFSF